MSVYRKIIPLLTAFAFVAESACSYMNPKELIRNNDDLRLYDYFIDELGNEGVVAYISYDSTKVMVISSDETVAAWGPCGFFVLPDKSGLLDAEESMVMTQETNYHNMSRFPAFKWCHDKNRSERVTVTDWMLPSSGELWSVWNYRADVQSLNNALINIGGTPISVDELYWTATENTDMRASCIGVEVTAEPLVDEVKSNQHRVRAVKYIRYKGLD